MCTARGVKDCAFAYASGGAPTLGTDGKFQVAPSKVRFDTIVADDEIDLESGFVMLPQAMPQTTPPPPRPPGGGSTGAGQTGGQLPPPTTGDTTGEQPQPSPSDKFVELTFSADRNQLYTAWNAMANLADLAGKVTVTVRAENLAGFDKTKLQNGVIEPLQESDLIK